MQAAEKALKAVLYTRDSTSVYMRSHDLLPLAGQVGDPLLIELAGQLESCTSQHTRMRYPDMHMYPKIPADVFKEEHASVCRDVASKIVERVQAILEVIV